MRVLTFIVGFVLIVLGDATQARERISREVKVGWKSRTYTAYLPDTASAKSRWPVLVVFHPGLANGAFMERTAQFHRAPEGAEYVVVYPDGFRRTWNSGDCCGRAKKRGIDDLGFFRAMMDDLSTLISIEPKAFLTGFSNGAIMSYHVACKMPEHVAAIAPFASAYSGTSCNSGNIPIFHIHGTDDVSAPVEGGFTKIKSFDDKRRQVPAQQSVEFFGAQNGCSLSQTEDWYAQRLKTSCRRYKSCEGGETTICVVDNLGHTWPGAPAEKNALGRIFGPARTDIDGTGAILTFFNRQRLK